MRVPPARRHRCPGVGASFVLPLALALGPGALGIGCRLFVDLDGIAGDPIAADAMVDGANGPPLLDASAVDSASDTVRRGDEEGVLVPAPGADAAADARPADILRECVLLLHMDEPSWSGPASILDSSGLANHATAAGTATNTPFGKLGGAVELDGSGWLDVADSPSLQFTDKVTYAAWVYPTQLGDGGRAAGIVSQRDGFQSNVRFAMFLWTDNHVWADVGSTPHLPSRAIFAASEWRHVAVTYDGTVTDATQRVRVYVDGALDSAHPAPASVTSSSVHLLIGNLPNGGDRFIGRIDEVTIWRRSLSPSEIASLAGAHAP